MSVNLNVVAVVLGWTLTLVGASVEDISYCDGCWCVPQEGESCPMDDMPIIEWPDSLIGNLQNITLENPYSLSCDPYNDDDCDTEPALEEGGVCAFEVFSNGTQCPEEYSYRIQTMPSREEAERNLMVVTHEGPCGACSSFQDLAVYLTIPNLASVGIECGFRALTDFDDGLVCYTSAGFSEECATLWIYNNRKTSQSCESCPSHAFLNKPNNEPAPSCALADCIQCDEDNSGPAFALFGGRTRRRSGILSAIVRPCGTLSTIIHRDPCDDTLLTAPPTASPTTSSTPLTSTDEASSETRDSGAMHSVATQWIFGVAAAIFMLTNFN